MNQRQATDTKIEKLILTLQTKNDLSKRSLIDEIKRLELYSDDLLEWEDFNHPVGHSYGRKTIYLDGQFELMVMSWLPGDFSMIHNHGDASWGVVQVFGELRHRVYKLEEMNLVQVKEETLENGQVIPVTHELIHQMGNATDEPILSLHFYFNEEESEYITDNTFLFDVVNGEVLTVRGGAFYGLPEDEILSRRSGLNASLTLKHQEERHTQERLSVIS